MKILINFVHGKHLARNGANLVFNTWSEHIPVKGDTVKLNRGEDIYQVLRVHREYWNDTDDGYEGKLRVWVFCE